MNESGGKEERSTAKLDSSLEGVSRHGDWIAFSWSPSWSPTQSPWRLSDAFTSEQKMLL